MKKFLVIMTFLAISLSNYAYDYGYAVIDGIRYYYVLDGLNEAEVVSNTNPYSGSVVIPAHVTIEGTTFTVSKIGSHAFENCNQLTSITIPETIKEMGTDAFYKCEMLNTVKITDLKAWCNIYFHFYWSNPAYYSQSLTLNGNVITNLTIPEGVTEIKDYAFYGNKKITKINLPNSVEKIGRSSFEAVSENGIGDLEIPEGVKEIGYGAFHYARITSLKLPSTIESISEYAFYSIYFTNYPPITIMASTPPLLANNAFYDSCYNHSILHVKSGCKSAYAQDARWSKFKNIKEDADNVLVSNISLNKTSISLLDGDSDYLTATVNPSNATDPSITWSSSNPGVAMVYDNGTVVGVTQGTAVVTATANDGSGKKATCTVNVKWGVKDIELNYTNYILDKGESVKLVATVTPAYANNKDVTWSSTNENVVMVSSTGTAVYVGDGTATVTATAKDGSAKKASCVFNCANGIINIKSDAKEIELYDINGNIISNTKHGIIIVKQADGTVKKILIK